MWLGAGVTTATTKHSLRSPTPTTFGSGFVGSMQTNFPSAIVTCPQLPQTLNWLSIEDATTNVGQAILRLPT